MGVGVLPVLMQNLYVLTLKVWEEYRKTLQTSSYVNTMHRALKRDVTYHYPPRSAQVVLCHPLQSESGGKIVRF
jgi:hypothetical protein